MIVGDAAARLYTITGIVRGDRTTLCKTTFDVPVRACSSLEVRGGADTIRLFDVYLYPPLQLRRLVS